MVPKKDGTWRPCRDYCLLNGGTTRDSYPLPHIHDSSAKLGGSKIFSKIDLVKGYHQIPMACEDVCKTAIPTPFGLLQFLRLPFGLKNATQAFQRLKDTITSKLPGVFINLNDILIMSATPKQHFRHLKALCEALRRFGLVAKQDKCVLGVSQLKFLGHSVSSKGIRPLPQKVCAFSEFTAPGSVKALQRFLDMIKFYRRFLPGIAEVLYPLMDALASFPKKMAWLPTMQPAFCKVK